MSSLHPDDLPLLTDIIDEDEKSAGIPTLTEVIADETVATTHSVADAPPDADFETHSIAHMAAELIWNAPAEPAVEPAVEPIVEPIFEPVAELATELPIASAERDISESEMQELVSHFEMRLETVFTEKLNRHFEHLHHQAVKLAISELKDELPELLRNVLGK